MYSDPILEEKWRVQLQLARQANYDLEKYVENAKNTVIELAKELKIELKFADIKGGYLPIEKPV